MTPQPKMPVISETKRCAIYSRKSVAVDASQDFNSLDAQREACLAFIQRQPSWAPLDVRYDDGGFTGANIDRPAFQRLLADVDAGKIDIVVVYKVDRLSRSLLDFAKVMERFTNAGASFVSVTQNFSTADAMGRLTMNMLMSFAEFEREMIGDRTRDKVAAARRKGKWTGGRTPFGYDLKEKRLVVNELDALVVREAFDLLLQQHHVAQVARTLNERGRWPRATRNPNGKPPRWTKDSLARLLRSPLYAGLIASGDEIYPGEHPALVCKETHDRAQHLLAGTGRGPIYNGINHDYVLRGLLRCGLCDAAMSPASTRKGTREYRYYRCSKRDKAGPESCSAAPLPADAIEAYVVERLTEAALAQALCASTRDALAERIRRSRTVFETTRRKLPSHIANLSANASRLVDDLPRLDGRAREVIEAKLRAESEKLSEAERQLADAERGLADLDGMAAEATWVTNALADLGKVWGVLTVQNRGRLLRALIDRIAVDETSRKVQIHLIEFTTPMASAQEAA